MMKRTKKVLVAALAAVMVLGSATAFTSCDALEGVLGNIPFLDGLFGTEATLEKIEVTTNPTKTEYVAGEKFDPAGMVVTAIYSDDTKQPVTNYTYTPTGALKKGDKIVISYTEGEGEAAVTKTTNLSGIKIRNDVVDVKIKTPATKTEYMVGETFNPAGMVLTVTYENGEVTDLAVADITVEYKTEPLTAADTVIKITYEGKEVEQAITFAKGVFIEAEDGLISSATVKILDDSAEASGGKYIGELRANDTVTFSFISDKAGTGDIQFRLASLYLKEDSNWTPIWMGDCQFNRICEFYVNGEKYNISDDAVLPGGGESGGTPDQNLWFNWKEVLFSDIDFVEGRNDIMLKFIPHDIADCSQSSFNNVFTANIDSLIVTSAECDVAPCEFEVGPYVATSVKLEKATVEGVESVYFVVEGTTSWVGYGEDEIAEVLNNSIVFDFQGNLVADENDRLLNTAANRIVTVTKTAEGEGTFKMMVDLVSLKGTYSTHFGDWVTEGADGSMQDFDYLATTAVATGETIELGYRTYTLVYDPTYSTRNNPDIAGDDNAAVRREHCYGCVGLIATNDQSLTYAYVDATLSNENDRAIYTVNGTYTAENYSEEELKAAIAAIYLDMQGNPYAQSGSWDGDWAAYRPECTEVVLDAENGTYQAKYDITDMNNFCYTSHYGSSSTDFKPGVEYTNTITIGDKIYTMLVNPADTSGAEYWGCVGVKIQKNATFNQTAKLVAEGDKVYLVIDSNWDNYTADEIASKLPEFNDLQELYVYTDKYGAYEKVVEGDNSHSYYINISDLVADTANPYFIHLVAGDMRIAVSTEATDLTVTVGGKTYTLSIKGGDDWTNGLTIVTVTTAATAE